MKNINFLIPPIIVLLTVFSISCSKESPAAGNQPTSAVIQVHSNLPNGDSRLAPRHYGSITGVLTPIPLKARIVAFNDQYVSEETTCRQDGSFELNNLVPGGYIIRIDYVPVGASDYYSVLVPKVVVIAGNVTNLGNINLD